MLLFTLTYNYNFWSHQISHSATSIILSCPFPYLVGYHGISILDCTVLTWDRGLVDCGTNILCGCRLFWKNNIQVYCWAMSNIIAGKRIRGRGVMPRHFIWLLSIKLGLWSCRLWYQHPSWVLTFLTKQDSGLLPRIFQYCCRKENHGESGDISPFHLIAQR